MRIWMQGSGDPGLSGCARGGYNAPMGWKPLHGAIALALACGCLLPAAIAAEAEASPPDMRKNGGYLDYLNAPHAWFSRRLGSLSRQIDSYFGSPDVYYEVSGSYLQLSAGRRLAAGAPDQGDVDFRLKVDLPRIEERLDLLLEQVADEVDFREDSAGPVAEAQGQQSGLFAGLRQVLVDSAGFLVNADVGVRLRAPPEPFTRLRVRRTWPFGRWQLRFKETLFWFDTRGIGQSAAFDLDRRLGPRFALRLSSRYDWLDESDELLLGHGVALYQILDERNSLAYEAGVRASNRPTLRSERYRLGLRFRRRVHEDWLFLSLVPDVRWAREDGFAPEPGVGLELEVLFGERYL